MIGEIVLKTVVEAKKEALKEISKETKKMLNDLDKPLNKSEVKENMVFKENNFNLKDLDKPLNYDLEVKETDIAYKENNVLDTNEKKDIDVHNSDISKFEEKQGGRFGDIFKDGEGETVEVHHMPADSVTELSRNDGPAIRMDKEDHRETASCGNSREAREYRERQKELIDDGKFEEAVNMDIEDIREKFGDKYDDAINEMLEYVEELKEVEKI